MYKMTVGTIMTDNNNIIIIDKISNFGLYSYILTN